MSDLGYRSEVVGEAKTPANRNRIYLIASVGLFVFFFLLDVLSWFTEGGGIFSITSALASVHSQLPVIDVDKSGLWLPFLVLSWIMVVAFCRVFDIQLDLSTRAKSLVPVIILVGGSFGLDAAFGEPLITFYMAGHGYHRCVIGDWAQGNGKGRVYFADYVLSHAYCSQHPD